jgi:hypothetical protein
VSSETQQQVPQCCSQSRVNSWLILDEQLTLKCSMCKWVVVLGRCVSNTIAILVSCCHCCPTCRWPTISSPSAIVSPSTNRRKQTCPVEPNASKYHRSGTCLHKQRRTRTVRCWNFGATLMTNDETSVVNLSRSTQRLCSVLLYPSLACFSIRDNDD